MVVTLLPAMWRSSRAGPGCVPRVMTTSLCTTTVPGQGLTLHTSWQGGNDDMAQVEPQAQGEVVYKWKNTFVKVKCEVVEVTANI